MPDPFDDDDMDFDLAVDIVDALDLPDGARAELLGEYTGMSSDEALIEEAQRDMRRTRPRGTLKPRFGAQ